MTNNADVEKDLITTVRKNTGISRSSKVYIIENDDPGADSELRVTIKERCFDPSNKRQWITHVLVVLLICALSAGAGFAVFVGQRAPQIVTFQTQLDRSVLPSILLYYHHLTPSISTL